jgi:hypothetical protein
VTRNFIYTMRQMRITKPHRCSRQWNTRPNLRLRDFLIISNTLVSVFKMHIRREAIHLIMALFGTPSHLCMLRADRFAVMWHNYDAGSHVRCGECLLSRRARTILLLLGSPRRHTSTAYCTSLGSMIQLDGLYAIAQGDAAARRCKCEGNFIWPQILRKLRDGKAQV